jgi:hypothetical protein
MEAVKQKLDEHKKVVVVLCVIVAMLIVFYLYRGEKFTNFTLDMTAARNPDPVTFKYTGRIKAPSGLDQYDNYYENKMLWTQGVADRLEGFPAFEPRVDPAFPAITPSAQNGFQFAAKNNVFQNSEVGWNEARNRLRAEKGPGAIITRAQIEAAALGAENQAAAAAVGDNASEAPGQDALSEKMSSRY